MLVVSIDVGILIPNPWLRVLIAFAVDGRVGEERPREDAIPPADVGTPIDEPIPLKFRLDGFVIADVILICGVELPSSDKFGDAFGVKNCGVLTPTLIEGDDTALLIEEAPEDNVLPTDEAAEDIVLLALDVIEDTLTVGACVIGRVAISSSQKYSTTKICAYLRAYSNHLHLSGI